MFLSPYSENSTSIKGILCAKHQVLGNQRIFVLVSVLKRFVIELERGMQKEDGWSKAHENASGKGILWCHFYPLVPNQTPLIDHGTHCVWNDCSCWVVFVLFFFGGGWGRVQLAFTKKYTCLLGGNLGKPSSVLFALVLCSSSLGKVESCALFKLLHLLNIRETDTLCSLPPYMWPQQSEQKWKCQSLSQVWLFATPWTPQTPLSMEFSRQEYWRG